MSKEIQPLFKIIGSMSNENSAQIIYKTNQQVVRKTYSQCYEDAIALAYYFQQLGIQKGDIIAIHGSTSYSWFVTDLACILIGALSLALYPSAPQSRILNAIEEIKFSVLLTEDYSSADIYRRAGCKVIWLSQEQKQGIESVGSLIAQFSTNSSISLITSECPFTIVSTSGTLSEPKFFVVHPEPLLYTMAQFTEIYDLTSEDSLLMVLPQSHLPQRMIVYGMIQNRSNIILSHPTQFISDAIEFSPTIHVVVPRILQYINTRLSKVLSAEQVPAHSVLVEQMFGSRVQHIFVGSAPTPKVVLQRLRGIGCPIHEIYGTTELGIIAMNTPNHHRIGTVGKVVDWGQIRIEQQSGEIFFTTKTPFLYGRLQDGEIIHDKLIGKNFTSTGDVGSLDSDGYLTLHGRTREFIALLNGEKIFVRPIEEQLAKIDGIEFGIVIGNGEKELSALIFIDKSVLSVKEEEYQKFIREELKTLNTLLHPWERIKKFLLVYEQPSVENGLLTETMKIRRNVIDEKYGKANEDYQLV